MVYYTIITFDTRVFLLIDLKLYYDKHLPPLASQVHQQKDMAASILNINSSMTAANAEWDSEWNQAGLGSRLSEQVCDWIQGSGEIYGLKVETEYGPLLLGKQGANSRPKAPGDELRVWGHVPLEIFKRYVARVALFALMIYFF